MEMIDKLNLLDSIKSLGFESVTVIGDSHGMKEDLKAVIDDCHSRNSFLISLGDIVDYGYDSVSCIEMMHDVVMNNRGLLVIGNHEHKLRRYFNQVMKGSVTLQISGGLAVTVNQLSGLSHDEYSELVRKFFELMDASLYYYILGDYLLVHGSATPKMWDIYGEELPRKEESRALFGQVDPVNRFNEDGYPNRIYGWVDQIPSGKTVIVGHDIRSTEKHLAQVGANGGTAIFLDTGCGKGGKLSTYVIDL